jgi:probable phosphoglycerate mutase
MRCMMTSEANNCIRSDPQVGRNSEKPLENKGCIIMINIYLVRHGEAAHSWADSADSELSTHGHQQALSVVKDFKDQGPLKIRSSPLLRARETATPLAKKWGEPIFIDDRFKEIPTDLHQKDRRKWLQGVASLRWTDVSPKLREWRANSWEALITISHDTVIFTHFMVINSLIAQLRDDDRLVSFQPDNASTTHLLIDEKGGVLLKSLGQEKTTLIN